MLGSSAKVKRIAILVGANRKTVYRKFRFLAEQARLSNSRFIAELAAKESKIKEIQFDEMESFEKSKCLPVSIPLIVDPATRKILGIRVCSMPAKGLLASISLRKYGPRKDERPAAASELLRSVSKIIGPDVTILTDQNPMYPGWIKTHFPDAKHVTTKGRRGCVVGQGELKAGGFDPLFMLNHTAAMIRDNVSRLVRRTWATTKRRDRLDDHLQIYMNFHNTVLT